MINKLKEFWELEIGWRFEALTWAANNPNKALKILYKFHAAEKYPIFSTVNKLESEYFGVEN